MVSVSAFDRSPSQAIRKIEHIYTGESLLRKLIEAVPERNEHQDDLREFESSLSARYATQLAQWKKDMEEWENDMTKPNPFEIKSECMFLLFS